MRATGFFGKAAIISMVMASSGALAQQTTPGFEPLNVARDPNGVDVLSGQITMPVPMLQLPIVPSLSIGRIQDMMLFASTTATSAGDSPSVSATFKTGGEVSESFSCIDGDCKTETARPGSMVATWQNGIFIYTEGVTGRQIIYDKLASKAVVPGSLNTPGKTIAGYWASSATFADGEVLTYDYDVATYGPNTRNYRIGKVTSSRGFELRIGYNVAATDIYNVMWPSPASASIYTSGANPVLLGSIAYGNGTTITDMAGNVWAISYGENPNGGLGQPGANYRPPTNAVDQIVGTSSVADKKGPLLSTITKDGTEVWNYTYSHAPNNSYTNTPFNKTRTVTVNGPLGNQRIITIVTGCDPDVQPGCKPYSLVTQEKDALNRTTKYSYSFKRLTKIELPEGNAVELVLDLMGNVTKKTQKAKLGSGLPDIVEEASYPNEINCIEGGTPVGCFRPNWVKDAKGNVTNYVWDSATGQLGIETKPADPNGIRPEIRYEYNRPHGKGISVKVKESMCKTSAATGIATAPCAGGALDEVVTQYEYTPSLLVKGITVTATGTSGVLETLRTCFTYDAQGRKISETQPLGTGSTCP